MLLKIGSQGEDVVTLQMTLKLRGYDIGPSGADGIFGQGTYNAVKKFQADHNLGADGIVGPATQEALHHDYSGNTDYGELIKMGSSGPQVAEIQRLLIKAGYGVGSSGVDGMFGQGTYNAVKRFQTDHKLGADGIVGPETKNALGFNKSGNYNDYVGGEGVKGFLDIAKSQLGYHEKGTNITKYGDWYGTQGAWCAMFVSWCAKEAGILNKVIPKYAWCESGADWYKNRNRYGWRGKYTPKPGDVVFFYNKNNSAPYYHTGIVEYVEGDKVHTIEGNSSDEVRRRNYSLSYSDIQGYGINGGVISKENKNLERLVISGSEYDGVVEVADIGIVGKRYKYNFIEPAISELSLLKKSYPSDKITWFISSVDYSNKDKENFKDTAKKLNVNIEFFEDKKEFKRYINNRKNLKIGSITVFAHGVPGSIEFGYNQVHTQKYNITIGDLEDIEKKSFSDECITKLYSCNAATKVEKSFKYLDLNRFAGKSFVEAWYKAGFGKVQGYNGKTDYIVIFGKDVHAHCLKQSKSKGYCESGAEEYPRPTNPEVKLIIYP